MTANATIYNIRVLNTINPPASVEQKCMLIDSKGLLWMGTNSGVKSYDGYRFMSYRSGAQTPNMLPNNSVLSMAEDKDNCLWIGTRNGLVCLDKQSGRFTTYHLKVEHSREIYALYTSHDGTLWIGTDEGVASYSHKTKKFKYYNASNTTMVETDGSRHSMPYINAKSFTEDRKGNIYIGTWSRGLYRMDRSRRYMYEYIMPHNDLTYMLMFDPHDRLWISTWGGGIKCLTNPSDFKNPGYTDLHTGNQSTAINYRIIHDPVTHTIWTCSRYGIGVLDEHNISKGFVYYNTIGAPDRSYAIRNVTDICTDGKGNIWAQTFNNGIYHINTQSAIFDKIQIIPDDAIANRVKSIFTKDGKQFWLTLAPSGVVLYNADTHQALANSEIPGFRSVPNEVLNTHMSSIAQAADGSIWFASNSYGIVALKDGKTKIYDKQNCKFVRDDFVKALHRSRRGIMFVGERYHLSWITPQGKTLGLDDDLDVANISEDSKGNIWVTTENKGILRLSGNFDSPRSLRKHYYNQHHGNYAVNDAIYVYEDSSGRVWATSNSGGLFRLDTRNNRFESMNKELHWDFDRIFSIMEDPHHRLWLTADDALICLSFADNGKAQYTTYTSENGLGDMVFMPNSCFKWGERLLFGSGRNLISVNTARVGSGESTPVGNVMVTDIIVDGRRYAELDSAMQRALGDALPQYSRRITIPAGVGKFAVEFAILSYVNSNLCKYAYFLEGYDTEWHYVDADVRQASFENIPSGRYKLHLKAADSNGRWTQLPYSISVRVLPPWYASPWAYLIYICMLIGGVYAAMKWYRERLRTKNRLQMAVIFTNITHELLTPLTVISASADSIASEHPELRSHTSLIHNNINRLTRMLRQILEVRKAQAGKLQLRVSEALLGEFCQETCRSIVPIFGQKHLTFDENIHCLGIKAWFDGDKIEKIIYNLLSNAVKYSNDGGRVSIDVSIADNKATIVVADTGIGISKDKMRHLYSRFLDGDYRRMNTMGTGIGLSLVRDLVRLHHGHIDCKSEVGKGTKFTITLPVDRHSYSDDEMVKTSADITVAPTAMSPQAVQAVAASTNAPAVESTLTDKTVVESGQHASAEPVSDSDKEYSVLLVEDNTELLQLMSSLLSPYFKVNTAVNGERAQRIIEKTALDIVVTDVMMPVMNGVELTQWIKQSEDYAQLPVVMLTAKTQDDDRNEGYRAGADAYLTKPFNLEDLRLRIMNIIQNRERIRQRFQQQTDYDVEEQHYSSPEKIFVENVIAKIKEHITDSEYGREQLAADLCISSSSLYNKLRATTGQNITSFISSIRLKEACRLLRQQPDIRINELSYRVGFSTPRYFSQCFKKEFGMVVKEYVEQQKTQNGQIADSEQ